MKTRVAVALLISLLPLGAAAQNAAPYAGQEQRAIKALSADEVKAYLAGEGMGLAKAGELNHYPGPKHVLGVADHLDLTPDQRTRLAAIVAKMSAVALPLGRQIVDAEAALDRSFAERTIDDAGLRRATQHIAGLQGRLREVHLSAHLATRALLTAEQIAAYDSMRGYDGRPSPHVH
jgi:Spy/CpxP family protein refolding chaperone